MSRVYSLDHVEAALCIWEWVIQCSLNSKRPEHEDLRRYHNAHGTVEMRHVCIRLADYCLKVYALLPDIRECFTFDWDIVPEIVGTIEWSVSPPARMVAADAARVVARKLASRQPKKGARA